MIFAVDPGDVESAYVIMDDKLVPLEKNKVPNEQLLSLIKYYAKNDIMYDFAIEMVASFGMPVGKEIFETVFWIGRFWEAAQGMVQNKVKIYRKEVVLNLCNSPRAKDGNVRQALIDRLGVVGTKKNPGWFYGFAKDVWSAYAVGVTYHDLYLKNKGEC